MRRNWIGTRQAGLSRLEDFLSEAGIKYEQQRNYDVGTEYNYTSGLSAYISRRIILEDEIISKVLARHSFNASSKFIQEILWRIYWKGWLELNQTVWEEYKRFFHNVEPEVDLKYKHSISGGTDVDCLNHWIQELVETGYLHNHTRMWFASIWIHHLKLPWQLGAKFFYEHLVDADAASNTLSWRWVAGLHTRGKFYVATDSNIKKYTNGRFSLPLTIDPQHINEDSQAAPLQASTYKTSTDTLIKPKVLIVTEEDLLPESLPEIKSIMNAFEYVLILPNEVPLKEYAIIPSKAVLAFSKTALDDALDRFRRLCNGKIVLISKTAELEDFFLNADMTYSMIHPYVGYIRDCLFRMFAKHKTKIYFYRRNIDMNLYPFAVKGYFHFKKNVLPHYSNISNLNPS